MSAKFSFMVGIRYMRSKRRDQFLSFISLIALIAMTLGVVALIVVLSVMNGFEAELRNRILTMVPHASIEARDGELQDWHALADVVGADPDVLGVAPYIRGEGMLSVPGRVRGAEITGIDPQLESHVSVVEKFMQEGSFTPLGEYPYRIVLGSLIARQLGVVVGDSVTLTVPKVTVTPAGVFPRSRRFTVAGIFEVGAQLDSSAAFIHIDDAAKMYQVYQGVDGLRLRTSDILGVERIVKRLAVNLPKDMKLISWRQSQGSLFSAVKMEKTMIGLLLSMVIAVAAFNIVSILSMMVADKTTDIAVLRTMGAAPYDIMRVFIVQGVGIGLIGAFCGGVLGVLIAPSIGDIIHAFEQLTGTYVFDPSVYFITKMPSVLRWQDVSVIVSGSLVLSFLATLLPAYHAAKITPSEALRYE